MSNPVSGSSHISPPSSTRNPSNAATGTTRSATDGICFAAPNTNVSQTGTGRIPHSWRNYRVPATTVPQSEERAADTAPKKSFGSKCLTGVKWFFLWPILLPILAVRKCISAWKAWREDTTPQTPPSPASRTDLVSSRSSSPSRVSSSSSDSESSSSSQSRYGSEILGSAKRRGEGIRKLVDASRTLEHRGQARYESPDAQATRSSNQVIRDLSNDKSSTWNRIKGYFSGGNSES